MFLACSNCSLLLLFSLWLPGFLTETLGLPEERQLIMRQTLAQVYLVPAHEIAHTVQKALTDNASAFGFGSMGIELSADEIAPAIAAKFIAGQDADDLSAIIAGAGDDASASEQAAKPFQTSQIQAQQSEVPAVTTSAGNPFALASKNEVQALNKYLVREPLGLYANGHDLWAGTGQPDTKHIIRDTNRWDSSATRPDGQKFGPLGKFLADVLRASGDRNASYNAADNALTVSRGLRVETVRGLKAFIEGLAAKGVTVRISNAYRDENANQAAGSIGVVPSDHTFGFAADLDIRCDNCTDRLDLETRILQVALDSEVQQLNMYGYGVRPSSLGEKLQIYAVHIGWSPIRNGGIESESPREIRFKGFHRDGYAGAQVGKSPTLSDDLLAKARAGDQRAQTLKSLWGMLADAKRLPKDPRLAAFYEAVNKQDLEKLKSLTESAKANSTKGSGLTESETPPAVPVKQAALVLPGRSV